MARQLKKEADRERVRQLLRHFHGLGYSLLACADPRRLKLKPKELLSLAHEAGVVFPDEREFEKRHCTAERVSP